MGQFMRGSSRGARTAWLGKVTVKASEVRLRGTAQPAGRVPEPERAPLASRVRVD